MEKDKWLQMIDVLSPSFIVYFDVFLAIIVCTSLSCDSFRYYVIAQILHNFMY